MSIYEITSFVSCLIMTGLIWTVQLVHYPSFKYIDVAKFKSFEKFHTSAVTWIVAPLMLVELFAALMLVMDSFWTYLSNLLSVFILWAMTYFLSVPCHKKLSEGYSEKVVNRLILTNWPRTCVWSIRSLFWVSILLKEVVL